MKLNFALCIHNHQPAGNFEHVFEEAYSKAYLPFLELLDKFPKIKLTMHYSGELLEFFLRKHPEFIEKLREKVKKGQIEIISGGFYEPLLCVIEEEDAIEQIKKLNNFIEKYFNVKPKGLWLAERIWEPNIPSILKKAEIDYTIVDDTHFFFAGLRGDELFGYYVTEDRGFTIFIFPGSKKLRYLIPFSAPEEVIKYLKEVAKVKDNALILMGDDGEKFGIWPGTYKLCYEEKWLERFFNLILENEDWIDMDTLSNLISKVSPVGKIYLPTSSYREMEEWALPADVISDYDELLNWFEKDPNLKKFYHFIKGGFWRNFFVKYPESNLMYSKMLYLSKSLKEFDFPEKEKAKDALFKAQCNDPYWHGVFGGLYLPHLRFSVYENLLLCEKIIEKHKYKGNDFLDYEILDFNQDMEDEILIKNKYFTFLFLPPYGGSLAEFSFKEKKQNLSINLSRRKEGYHRKIEEFLASTENDNVKTIHEIFTLKDKDVKKYLFYDKYCKFCFIDHIFSENIDFTKFKEGNFKEEVCLYNSKYDFKIKKYEDYINLILEKDLNSFSLSKIFEITKTNVLNVIYKVYNSNVNKKNLFGVELNFNLLSPRSEDRYIYIDRKYYFIEDILLSNINSLYLIDEINKLKIGIFINKKAGFWHFPLMSISQSESGIEKIYQGSTIVFLWDLKENFSIKFSILVEEL